MVDCPLIQPQLERSKKKLLTARARACGVRMVGVAVYSVDHRAFFGVDYDRMDLIAGLSARAQGAGRQTHHARRTPAADRRRDQAERGFRAKCRRRRTHAITLDGPIPAGTTEVWLPVVSGSNAPRQPMSRLASNCRNTDTSMPGTAEVRIPTQRTLEILWKPASP